MVLEKKDLSPNMPLIKPSTKMKEEYEGATWMKPCRRIATQLLSAWGNDHLECGLFIVLDYKWKRAKREFSYSL
jgi:hypothetical protein